MGHHDLRTTLGATPLVRDLVVVSGPEAAAFLQGQLSQDVEGLAVGTSAPALLLQPTGKVAAWLRVTHTADDAFALDVEPGWGEAVATRLRRFRLRTKAEITLGSWRGHALRGPGAATVAAAGGRALPACWPGVEGVDLLDEDQGALLPDGIPLVAAEALEALRIECGVPAMGAELSEATIPAEAGQWLIDSSVSFTKGCYTGQELVARIDSRGGNVPRPLRGLRLEGDPAPVGADILHASDGDDRGPLGALTSSGWSLALGAVALAPLGRGVAVGTEVLVRWADGHRSAVVAELPLR